MMLSACSASDSTRSRWSATPSEKAVRHVPHVPLSQELGVEPCAPTPQDRLIRAHVDGRPRTGEPHAKRMILGAASVAASAKLSIWIDDIGQ